MKVLFRVVIKKQNKDENPQVVVTKVGQRLAVTVKSGNLGDYKIVPMMELRGKPLMKNYMIYRLCSRLVAEHSARAQVKKYFCWCAVENLGTAPVTEKNNQTLYRELNLV